MSDHVYNREWTIHDPIPEGLKDSIAGAVSMNMKIQPGAFAIFGHADGINYWCWTNWTTEKDHDKRIEMIEEEAKSAPNPERFKEICMHVLEKIEEEEQ
jgi:hypothetical protein